MPLPNSGFYGNSTFPPKPLARRAGEVQCLGEMPWVPGDCDQARQWLSDAKNSRESITLHFNSSSLRGRQAAFGGRSCQLARMTDPIRGKS
jgi:hypothetical protein